MISNRTNELLLYRFLDWLSLIGFAVCLLADFLSFDTEIEDGGVSVMSYISLKEL